MLRRLRALASTSTGRVGGYFGATSTKAAVNFLSVPLLVRALGPAEFGSWALLEPLVLVFAPIALFGTNFGAIKQIAYDGASPLATFRRLALRGQVGILVAAVAGATIAVAVGFNWRCALTLAAAIYAEAIQILLLAIFRSANRIAAFAASTISRALVLLLVYSLAVSHWAPTIRSAQDVLTWRVAADVISIAAGLIVPVLRHDGAFLLGTHLPAGKNVLGDAIRYGAPILVASVFGMVVDFADRYVLRAYADVVAVGYYAIYLKIAAILDPLVIQPFALWWPTVRFERQRDSDGGHAFFRAVSIAVLGLLLLLAGSLWLVSSWLLRWFAPGVPQANLVILALLAAIVFRAVAPALNIGPLTPGYTHWNALAVAISAMVGVSLSFLLIPRWGIMGAALSSMGGYAVYSICLNLVSQRIYWVPFPYARMFLLTILAIVEGILIGHWSPASSAIPSISRAMLFVVVFLITAIPIALPAVMSRAKQQSAG